MKCLLCRTIIGLETIHEFHFQWSSTPWWACSICFESGSTAEEVDLHLQSLAHLKTFVVRYSLEQIICYRFDSRNETTFNFHWSDNFVTKCEFQDEFYPDKAKEIKETAPNLLYDQLYGLRDELFDAQGINNCFLQ